MDAMIQIADLIEKKDRSIAHLKGSLVALQDAVRSKEKENTELRSSVGELKSKLTTSSLFLGKYQKLAADRKREIGELKSKLNFYRVVSILLSLGLVYSVVFL